MYGEKSIGLGGQFARSNSDPLEGERKYKPIWASRNPEQQSCPSQGHNMIVRGRKWNYQK
jgi:hypothetical protein